MCFLALVGCLRPTTDFETLSKDPKWVFEFVKAKYSGLMAMSMYVHTAKFPPCKLKQPFWVFAQSLRVSGWPQAAHQR